MTDPAALAARLAPDFVLGTATAAIQVEGAATEDGRGPSGWDVFAAEPGRILDGSTPAVAADHYHRLEEDVALMRDAGFDGYRFSIGWPRLQPTGTGPLNPAGLAFYDRLLDLLLAAGIRPMATLYHWDTPLPLEQAGGWLTRRTAERFGEYVALVGTALGDRVADWVTLNEPATVVLDGYALGIHAPGQQRLFRSGTAARNLLVAHGLAVQALRSVPVVGRIGIVNAHTPVSPASDSSADRRWAALLDVVHNRQYADPVLLGRRPQVPRGLPLPVRMALALSGRLSAKDLALASQPLDFYGLNYYFPSRVAAGPDPDGSSPDGHVAATVPFHLTPWPDVATTGFGWPVLPEGLRTSLEQLRDRYPGLPPVTITESGRSGEGVEDPERVDYLARHLAVLADGVPGVDVEGYYVWSLLDNFEWAAGYTQRFGIVHVDFADGTRTPKSSYRWLAALQAARKSS